MVKSKTQLKPRDTSPSSTPVSGDVVEVGSNVPELPAAPAKPAKRLDPVKPQPLMFKISLALFVGWLLYLAFIAYVVMSK